MDIKNLTNEELIQLFKENECNLKRIESKFGSGKNAAGRLYLKRGIDYNSIKNEWLHQLKINYENNPKLCKCCHKPIPYEEKDKKDFCSQSCAASFNNIQRGYQNRTHNQFCLNCGKELTGDKVYNKHCCRECQIEYQYKLYINRWKEGLEDGVSGKYGISHSIRKYLFSKYNNSCQKCGWKEINPITNKVPLQIHHIDGDCLNNREDNLQLLCPNCHSLTETFGNLNTNSKRIYRKQKENL